LRIDDARLSASAHGTPKTLQSAIDPATSMANDAGALQRT
jgi:hypothetical protein